MEKEQMKNNIPNITVLEPAFSILYQIQEKIESLSKPEDSPAVLEESLVLCGQAREIFVAQDQPWLAAWMDIKKAALHCDLAYSANYMGKAVQTHTGMELVKEVLESMPSYPSNLNLAAKLYIAMIDTLFRIRALYEKPEQLDALDNLIYGVSQSLGEIQALDLSFRSQANDLNFCAGILESLAEIEEDPQIRDEIEKTSQYLERKAASNLMISSPLDLSGYQMPGEEK